MHRFFINSRLSESHSLLVTKSDPIFHQIGHVFRAKKGQEIIFFESEGADILYEIVDLSRDSILFHKKVVLPQKKGNKTYHITLFQAYPNKLSTLELLVQKIVEVGVQKLVLFPSEYSQMSELPNTKTQRITMIAQEAMEQSGGNIPLVIEEKKDLDDICSDYSGLLHIVGHLEGERQINISSKEIGFWVGPEGGWSPKEKHFFTKNNFLFWSFNDHILRLETAAIVGSGMLSYLASL